jgi:hypothetical protein
MRLSLELKRLTMEPWKFMLESAGSAWSFGSSFF